MKEFTLPTHTQFLSSAKLREIGYSYYYINKMVSQGLLVKINKSIYENMMFEGETSDFSYLSAIAPNAVVCLMSAARFYNLTTFIPDAVDIAIENSMKITTLPEWPEYRVYYFSKERYETGVATADDGTTNFQIYDIEKTVVDILGYRNKLGVDAAKEVLCSYLGRKDRNLNKLHRYAQKLGVEPILRTYLEVLI
ncbi:MAG: hypothetical protein Q4G19_00515 [Clostridia bacterium]|nr:hypothetical protein [Clostridia bacterium]